MALWPLVFVAMSVGISKTSGCGFYDATSELQEITTSSFPQNTKSCDWTIKAISPNKGVYLRFVEHSQTGKSSIQVLDGIYIVAVFPESSSGKDEKFVINNRTAIVRHLGPSFESYGIHGISFHLQYRQVDRCGGTFLHSGGFSAPNYPSFAPPNTKCSWNLVENEKQQQKESHFFELFLNNVQFSKASDLIEVYNPSKRMRAVTDNSSYHHISFLRVYMETGSEPTTALKFTASFNYKSCIRNLTATDHEQILQTPGYPSYDVGSLQCTWTIRPLSSSKSIKVQVLNITTERYSGGGTIEILLTNSSHPHIPHPIFSTSGSLKYELIYDPFNLIVHSPSVQITATGIMRGFRLVYSQVTKCGFDTSDLDGTVSTNNFPQSIPPNTQCAWNLYGTKPTEKDEDMFEMIFDTVQHSTDPDAVLQVYDMHGFLTDLYKDQYRNFATEDVLRVYYNSGTITGKPFKATYRFNVCRYVLTASPNSRTITTPGFPFFQPKNYVSCNFVINPSAPSKSIQIKISRISFFSECCSSTRVFEGQSQIVSYVDGTETIDLVARKFPVEVDFWYEDEGPGRSIVYREVPNCGFSTNSTKGIISSPNYPQKAEPNLICEWTFYPPQGISGLRTLVIRNPLQIDQDNDIFVVHVNRRSYKLLSNTTNDQLFTANGVLRVRFETGNRSLSSSRLWGEFDMKVCGGTFRAKATEQSMISFGMPEATLVNSNFDCEWTITAQPSNSIFIYIERMQAHNGLFTHISIQWVFDRSESFNEAFVIHSQTARVSFTGALLTFSYLQVPTCGRDIYGNQGQFSSREIPASNQPRTLCGWNFVGSGRLILMVNVFNTSTATAALKVYTDRMGAWATLSPGQRAVFHDSKPIQVFVALDNTIKERIFFDVSYQLGFERKPRPTHNTV